MSHEKFFKKGDGDFDVNCRDSLWYLAWTYLNKTKGQQSEHEGCENDNIGNANIRGDLEEPEKQGRLRQTTMQTVMGIVGEALLGKYVFNFILRLLIER